MSRKQWGHGFDTGYELGFDAGYKHGSDVSHFDMLTNKQIEFLMLSLFVRLRSGDLIDIFTVYWTLVDFFESRGVTEIRAAIAQHDGDQEKA